MKAYGVVIIVINKTNNNCSVKWNKTEIKQMLDKILN